MLHEKIARQRANEVEAFQRPIGDVEAHLEELGGWRHDLPFNEALDDLNRRIEASRAKEAERAARENALVQARAAEQARIKDSIRPVMTPPMGFAPPVGTLLASLRNGAMVKENAGSQKIIIRRPSKLDQALDRFNTGRSIALTSIFGLAACATLALHSPEKEETISSPTETDISVSTPSKTIYCSPEMPMLVEGKLNTFRFTDNDTCRRILQAVPKPSDSFTTYNKNISLRGLENGNFEFRLLRFDEKEQNLTDWIQEKSQSSIFGSGKLRQAYLDIYKKETGTDLATGKDDFIFVDRYLKAEKNKANAKEYNTEHLALGENARVQRAMNFRKDNQISYMAFSPVSAENLHGIVEGWLISGGDEKEPLPYSFMYAKWNLESNLGNNIVGKIARGLNQFTIATYLTAVKRDAEKLGLSEDRAQAIAIWKRHHMNDKLTIKDPEFISIWKKEAKDVHKSGSLGAMNTTVKINIILDDLRSGEICLPDGRKTLQEVDGYIGHFLAGNYKQVYRALCHTPDKKMIDILPGNVYRGNINLFEDNRLVEVNGKKSYQQVRLSVTEFYHKLSHDYGFGNRELYPQTWTGKNRIEPGSIKYTVSHGLGTSFQLVANENSANNVVTVPVRENVDWIVSQHRGVSIETLVQAANGPS